MGRRHVAAHRAGRGGDGARRADDSAARAFAITEVATRRAAVHGEPITLTLKDADIKDVLKTFSVLTDLNIVLDPAVSAARSRWSFERCRGIRRST